MSYFNFTINIDINAVGNSNTKILINCENKHIPKNGIFYLFSYGRYGYINTTNNINLDEYLLEDQYDDYINYYREADVIKITSRSIIQSKIKSTNKI